MKNNTINMKCLFHFSQMLIRKLSNLGFKKKKLNKQLIEIVRNIQILVFLKKEKKQDFEKIILNEINKFDDISKFRKYLQKYIFKIINEGYNFEKLINEYYEKNNKKSLEKLYFTNNICESINSKINFYLPKKITTNYDFITNLSKIFINSKSEKITFKKHRCVSRAIIKIIIDEKLNENLRWIKFDEFKAKQKYIITGYELDLEENEINKLIEAMNNIDILSFEEKKIQMKI